MDNGHETGKTDPRLKAVGALLEKPPASKQDVARSTLSLIVAIAGAAIAGWQGLVREARAVAHDEGAVQSAKLEVLREDVTNHKAESTQVHSRILDKLDDQAEDTRALYRYQKTRQPERRLEVAPATAIIVKEPDAGR